MIHRRAFQLYARTHFGGDIPILIYQMGKVGSTSLLRSLKQRGLHLVYRLHVLNPQNLYLLYPVTVHPDDPLILNEQKMYASMTHRLHDHLFAKQKPVKVITPIRDPIARNISMFFENLLEYHLPVDTDLNTINIDVLIDKFFHEVRHTLPLEWFDLEMHTMLGIDVYQYPFPKEQGYLRICRRNIDLLLLKSELEDRTKTRIIAEHLGLNDFHLQRFNQAQQKPYAHLYQAFQEAFEQCIEYGVKYRERMTAARYFQHFYG